MGNLADRIVKTQEEIRASAEASHAEQTSRHTVYWKPSELEAVREFGNENFLSIAETIRGGLRWILADAERRDAMLKFLKEERRHEARRKG